MAKFLRIRQLENFKKNFNSRGEKMPTRDQDKLREKWRRNKAAYRERQRANNQQEEDAGGHMLDVNTW